MPRRATLLILLAAAATALLCSSSANAQGPPALGSLSDFAAAYGSSTSSNDDNSWLDLSVFGQQIGISSKLMQTLAHLAKTVFTNAASFKAGVAVGVTISDGDAKGPDGGPHPPLPPPLIKLPPLPKSHKLAPWATKHGAFLELLAEKWSGAIVAAQFSPGFQGFLSLMHLQDEQEALIKWMCIIYPWEAAVPDVLRDVRDSYCSKALPASAVTRLFGGGGPPRKFVGPAAGPHPGLAGGPGGIVG